MSGKGSGRGSYQCQGVRGVRVRGRSDRGYSYYGATTKNKGLCSALGNHVFDYSQKAPEDQIIDTREKLVHHVGTIHGNDIVNELQN